MNVNKLGAGKDDAAADRSGGPPAATQGTSADSPNRGTAKRRRRSADEAKQLVLETAAGRLKELGLEGLNLTGVADQAGISHATIIHHFGSSEGMRHALIVYMTRQLLSDVLGALQSDADPATLCEQLFAAIADNGHAQLLAWMAVESRTELAQPILDNQDLFRGVIDSVATRLCRGDHGPGDGAHAATEQELAEARQIVLLIATTALGLGIAGQPLTALLELDANVSKTFPAWLAERITRL
ncbi:MAG: TetR/AcrR family transcriptional regulator [Pseudomonadota bacterium]